MTTHQRNFPSIDPEKIERLAATAVKVGLRLQAGQDLFLTAPVAALPLARRIAAEAYKAGAGLVTPILSDEEMTLARYRFATDASFDRAPGWLYEGVGKAFAANTARLAIVGEDPMLLSQEDPTKVARANKANSIAYQPALEKIAGFDINWNIVAYPTASWAKRVFPQDAEEVAVGKLAEAIFSASRIDNADPVAAWDGAQRRSEPPDRMAECAEVSRSPLFRPGNGSHHRPRRRPRVGGRGRDREERHRLQSQHPDRGGVHHAPCAPGRRPCRQHQAALLSGHADRRHRGALRRRAHRRGEGRAGRGRLEKSARHGRGRAPSGRGRAGAAFLADLEKRAVVLQHAVRRERRLPYRAWTMLREVLRRRRRS